MDQESKSKVEFLSLAEELRLYILSFLPCRDILRCTSACKALRQMYMSSSELQYTVELSGQRLLPVPNPDDHTPISERLQLLRDKAHAWFDVDFHSFETVSLWKEIRNPHIIDGHIYTWDIHGDVATFIPILPKPSQQIIQRDQWQRTLSSITSTSHSLNLNVFMDLAQNLIAVLHVIDRALYIGLGALDGDGVHPLAAGQRLSCSVLPGSDYSPIRLLFATMKCFGRHIALRWVSRLKGKWLQIWDWQGSTTSNCLLNDNSRTHPNEFCFLGNNRLLVIYHESDLNLYSIEDTSQAPQLLACFSMPISLKHTRLCAVDYNGHMSQPKIQIQQTTYISDPKHWLVSMAVRDGRDGPVFIISTRVFHDFAKMAGVADLEPIPWARWGPSNTRIFSRNARLCGNRVFQAVPIGTPDLSLKGYRLHMMDFSPLAVTNRRGLGRVVTKPSTTDIIDWSRSEAEESLTTSLPYVEVQSYRVFNCYQLRDVWVHKDRIYLDQFIWTNLFGPIYLDQFIWTNLFGPIYLDQFFQNSELQRYSTLEVIDV
ncbi:hypothetical protein DEU56DRAFT_407986 [Suillus clintonianus]|uniref:uncharacterized protein n=1 Tax=Suillus clintonianus TaxID=1904413 RepID=UPI001B87A8DC|nr:uncharacterized protein DEU56DRAFT_407986 [Suillus clintonianus]KAG2134468.1 hypothetical protein DEU56DRAFT_407986 [Suillus clintonianus]